MVIQVKIAELVNSVKDDKGFAWKFKSNPVEWCVL